jgi:predicted DNA-binding transcriptional regulator AlpA
MEKDSLTPTKPTKKYERESEAAVYTVTEFCAGHRIGRAFFYKLLQEGRAPRTMKVGRRRFISREEAARWRERMVAENGDPEAT